MREAAKDRISGLPDPILHHIHSFLHIKDGARTSALSKRWKYIWTTVPVLEFQNWVGSSSSRSYKFIDFVDGTLHRHNSSNIDKFSLTWQWGLEKNSLFVKNKVHSWISTVVKGNVKDLSLWLCQLHPWFVPLSLFTSKSLTSLQIQTQPSIRLPKYISLTRLKRLVLREFEFSDESWNEQLFSNSPVLEELILEFCMFRVSNFCISIPTLKTLKIKSWFGEENVGLEATRQLLRALSHVKCLTVCDETLQAIYYPHNPSNNLPTFHNVKELSIAGVLSTDEGLISLLRAVPNLESLVLHRYMNAEIEKDSNEDKENDTDEDCIDDAEGDDDNEDIDAGSIEGENNHNKNEGDAVEAAEYGRNDESEDNYDPEEDSSALDIENDGCLFPHLKSVCFQEFVRNPREMKWVRQILRDAKDLQTMAICYYGSCLRFVNAKSKKELLVEIPKFTRASAGCMFKFYS